MKYLHNALLFVAVLALFSSPSIDARSERSLISRQSHIIDLNSLQLGSWSTAAPMPWARKQIRSSTVNLDGKIYVIGGVLSSNGAITDAVDIYDPETDSWTVAAALPLPLWRTAAAVVDGKIYLFGGYRSTAGFPFNPTNRAFVYDPAIDQWIEIASMPTTRGSHVAIEVDGRIHLIGGAFSGPLGTHEIYDPASDSYSVAVSMPTARAGSAAALVGNRIYVTGGYFLQGGVVRLGVHEAYDLSINLWTRAANYPANRAGLTAVEYGGEMLVFGGPSASDGSKAVAYDPLTDTWRELADMPTPGVFLGAARVGDRVYVMGGGENGLDHRDANNLNQVFTPPQYSNGERD